MAAKGYPDGLPARNCSWHRSRELITSEQDYTQIDNAQPLRFSRYGFEPCTHRIIGALRARSEFVPLGCIRTLSGMGERGCHEQDRPVDEDEDFLDEMIRESTDRSPEFPELMERARRHREALGDVG